MTELNQHFKINGNLTVTGNMRCDSAFPVGLIITTSKQMDPALIYGGIWTVTKTDYGYRYEKIGEAENDSL